MIAPRFSHNQEPNTLSHYRGVGRWGAPLRDHLWQGPPVTRNAEIDPGDNDPPPKMTQGVMTPLTPLHHLQQHPRAGSQGVGIATLIFRYFLRYFSSTHRTDLSRFRGTFHSFDPFGFAIFAILRCLPHRRSSTRRVERVLRHGED